MALEAFIEKPWSNSNIHDAYSSSFLHMRPAPEYASGEVVLASTYRAVGFGRDVITEGKVPANGRAFQKWSESLQQLLESGYKIHGEPPCSK